MAAILLLWLAIRLAQPIADTDVFWHMVYAKQMIARHTLRTDHTLYSWMPSSNEMMYCAWLSEMLLLGLWNWSGIAGLAVLRYSAVLLTVVLPAWFAWRAGILRLPFTWLLILFATILGLGATQPKPELFSLLMWHVLLFCYFRFRLAIRQNTDTTRWLYAMPALMLLWVNLHGGFILAGPFLAVTLVAEWIPAWAFPEWLRPAYRLPQVLLRKMTLAWAAALLAIAVTPYGPQYPLQLFADLVLHRTPRPDGIWNSAMQSSFSVAGFNLHLPEFLAFMALVWIVLLTLSVRRGPVDWLIPALNLIYVPLYIAYLRSTFLLPVLFAFSVIWWISAQPLEIWSFPRARLLRIAPLALFLFWIGRSTYELRANPEGYTWIGFGFGYMQPVAEAEFVANLNLGPRLYNMYNSGGYLIWRLYPQYQVMCDPRSFPYLSWFHELYNFTRQASKEEFQQFLLNRPIGTGSR